MRKFKVTKKWPGGIEIGSVLHELSDSPGNVFLYPTDDEVTPISELEGFVEEINEPEVFWFLDSSGIAYQTSTSCTHVPVWLRFPTKEHTQAFADGMKRTLDGYVKIITNGCGMGPGDDKKFSESFNSRRNHD